MTEYPRVEITKRASELVDRLREQHGELIFHQSGGCCDGSSPMCLKKGDLRIGAQDVLLGEIHGCPFYMSAAQFEYWKHTHLTIDVTEGRGSSFSLEIPLGLRFVTKSRLFTEEEAKALKPVRTGDAKA
ncbi:MAG TPA: DUF779 domain-containing protein [Bryobacteraceae bacterium]|mgnify:FL=1|nr:DUF779 domain-containing protein [Bryobacteraceae bacterium]HOL70128.1 DUF779 domain-containing protein [Bryobacteraceae bacterium]HOQ46251.1 DUF779 domain-containing protein [Bryobacteraceae bacterium]HPQ16580.1 DUF779 domain-containing protein [Bryobacteraceae bacterium]HPU74240.1 DUF779 domain-containing protein [Bryobacteraceae bacterium]